MSYSRYSNSVWYCYMRASDKRLQIEGDNYSAIELQINRFKILKEYFDIGCYHVIEIDELSGYIDAYLRDCERLEKGVDVANEFEG